MTESLLLALVGASLGLLLALWLKDLIRAFGPVEIPRIDEITIDAGVLVFAGVATLFAAMLFRRSR